MNVTMRRVESGTYRIVKDRSTILVGYIRHEGRGEWTVVDHIIGRDIGVVFGPLKAAKDYTCAYFAERDFCTGGCGRLITGGGECARCHPSALSYELLDDLIAECGLHQARVDDAKARDDTFNMVWHGSADSHIRDMMCRIITERPGGWDDWRVIAGRIESAAEAAKREIDARQEVAP
jgi:hypothetical protein